MQCINSVKRKKEGRFMDKKGNLNELMNILEEAEQATKSDADNLVQIEHCINIKKMSDYKVFCSYQDVVFIICILKEYLKLIADKEDPMWDYYRDRFAKLADRLACQIEYDYEAQMEKCLKKMSIKDNNSDIGEDGVSLAIKRRR